MQFSLGMGKTLFLKMRKYPPRPSLSRGPLRVIVPVVESLGGISTLTPVVCKISAMVLPRWPITYLCCDFGTSTDTNVHFFSYNTKTHLHDTFRQIYMHSQRKCSVLNWIPVLSSHGSTSKLTISWWILRIRSLAVITPSFSPAMVISSFCTESGGILILTPVSFIRAVTFSLCAPLINGWYIFGTEIRSYACLDWKHLDKLMINLLAQIHAHVCLTGSVLSNVQ